MKRRAAAAAAVVLLLAGLSVQLPGPAGAQATSSGSATLPPPDVLGDCTGAVPVIVASDADAQSDIYSAVTLAGVLGATSCIVLAGGRDEPFPPAQLNRLATTASGGYVVGGPAAVPDAKLSGRDMFRVWGADRWETAAALRSSDAPDDMCMSLYRNGEPIFEHQTATPLLPASLIKLATATVVLSELGADATFTTRVVADAGALAAVSDGVLRGDLYLIGGGDPVLATPGYINRIVPERPYTDVTKLADSVMAALDAHGIDTIEGAIVGDGSWFADGEQTYTSHYPPGATPDTPPVWKQSYMSQNFVGVLSGLVINDGYSPYTVSRLNHTRSADATQAAASDFDDLLEARGMVIRHRPRSGSAPSAGDATSLGTITSPPVEDILVRILRISENTPAEMLFKQIGRHHGDSSRAASAAAATTALRDLLGSAADGVVLVDGSGLSIHNRLSCEAAVRLLLLAGADSRLVASLSIAGRTPTLQSCGPRPAAPGGPTNTVYAKGGQLNDSSSVAGVATAPNGDVLTFAMIANEPLIIRLGSCNALRQLTFDAVGRYTYGPGG